MRLNALTAVLVLLLLIVLAILLAPRRDDGKAVLSFPPASSAALETPEPSPVPSATARRDLLLPPGDNEVSVSFGGNDRRFTVHVPAGHKGSEGGFPVVVMLHGGGGTGKAAADETGWSEKADAEGFLAVYPNALPPDPRKRSSFARNPQLWNDGSERFYEGQEAVDDVAYLSAVLDEVERLMPVDLGRIYICGFSNGASMSFRAGTELSSRIAAIAPVAGACWSEAPVLARPVPMLYLTGTEDPLNIIEGGAPKLAFGGDLASDNVRSKPKPPVRESIRRWLVASGCKDTPSSVTDENGIRIERFQHADGSTEVVYITVTGLGHTWAGGRSLLPEFMVGKTTDKLKATDTIWEFFKAHKLEVSK